jgi:hypothetical protein
MASLVLGPMLRHVSRTTATVWVETDAACRVAVRLPETDRVDETHTFCVGGHHYALVVMEGLAAATEAPYEVLLDDEVRWPEHESRLPPSVLRTLGDEPLRVLVGSCRAAAPHAPPWSLEPRARTVGRGADALRAHGLRMLEQAPSAWPHLFVLVGDQVYADDSSPGARDRIDRRRDGNLPPEIVADFEEYTWLYHESWSPEVERWVFANVPSAMIFDDHDMVDDWNISASWVRHIRSQPWWREHVVGGLTSYWVYQHLGNLSPDDIRADGMLDELLATADGEPLLREWAFSSEEFTPTPGGYRFSFHRELGDAHLIVIDCRNGRVLEAGDRAMLDADEWNWVVEHACVPQGHLLLATTLPVFVPGGLHDLQAWNEAVCDGAWGRPAAWLGERLRRALDLEDWPAFHRSFEAFVDLVIDIGSGRGRGAGLTPPATITVLSGDIHFSYRAALTFPARLGVHSRVAQVVSSPIRNALAQRERRAIRFSLSRTGKAVGRFLARRAHVARPQVEWELVDGPLFANCMAELTFDGPACTLVVERAHPRDDGGAILDKVLRVEL